MFIAEWLLIVSLVHNLLIHDYSDGHLNSFIIVTLEAFITMNVQVLGWV